MTEENIQNGKTTAIISYLTIIGAVIAIFMNQEPKNSFARFHIRQAFGIHLLFWLLGYPVGYFNSIMISSAFWVFNFILWLYGFLGATQGQMNEIPVIGKYFQKWFTFIS